MKHKKKSKVESSSGEDSDSSSSSSSSESASSNDSHKKSALKKKKANHPHSKETKKSQHSESYDSFPIDSFKEAQRKTHRSREDGHFKRPQTEKESHSRETKERHRDQERGEKPRHENTYEKRNFRHDRDSREDPDNYRRHRHHEQYNNYNRNDYQRDTGRERNRRPNEPHRNQRYKDRDDKQYDDRRGNRFNRNNRDRSRSRSFDHTNAKWGKHDDNNSKKEKSEPVVKEKPNFGLSGKLTEERNTYRGVVIKYSEPPEARKPKRRWRLYPFKGEKALQTLFIHRESAYLIGRERKVVDLAVDHPSCSKQHAALQYRLVPFTREDGSAGKRVRPYLIDLDSANGTYVNNKKIDPKKYIELLERDVIKFGFSSREYVLLHENSKDEIQDDDVKLEDEEAAVKKEEAIKEED